MRNMVSRKSKNERSLAGKIRRLAELSGLNESNIGSLLETQNIGYVNNTTFDYDEFLTAISDSFQDHGSDFMSIVSNVIHDEFISAAITFVREHGLEVEKTIKQGEVSSETVFEWSRKLVSHSAVLSSNHDIERAAVDLVVKNAFTEYFNIDWN